MAAKNAIGRASAPTVRAAPTRSSMEPSAKAATGLCSRTAIATAVVVVRVPLGKTTKAAATKTKNQEKAKRREEGGQNIVSEGKAQQSAGEL